MEERLPKELKTLSNLIQSKEFSALLPKHMTIFCVFISLEIHFLFSSGVCVLVIKVGVCVPGFQLLLIKITLFDPRAILNLSILLRYYIHRYCDVCTRGLERISMNPIWKTIVWVGKYTCLFCLDIQENIKSFWETEKKVEREKSSFSTTCSRHQSWRKENGFIVWLEVNRRELNW